MSRNRRYFLSIDLLSVSRGVGDKCIFGYWLFRPKKVGGVVIWALKIGYLVIPKIVMVIWAIFCW